MAEDMSYLVFYDTWHFLAEGRDTDSKRLAFYDAIMRYAFEGIEPEKPVRGESPGEAWAAWDAFVVAKDKIDSHRAKARAGRNGKGVSRNVGNTHHSNQNQNKINSESIQDQNIVQNEINTKDDINKNRNKNRNIFSLSKERHTSFLEESFDSFWKNYPTSCPRKVDKKKCRAKWKTLFKDAEDGDALLAAIMDGLEKWKASEQWKEDGGKYIRAPYVWLNNRNWEDAPAAKPPDEAEARRQRFEQAEKRIREDLRRKGLM